MSDNKSNIFGKCSDVKRKKRYASSALSDKQVKIGIRHQMVSNTKLGKGEEKTMNQKDASEIQKLVREGKLISKVWEEDFPAYEYWDVYMAAYDGGERSALGVKRMITNRLNKMVESKSIDERKEIMEELDELVWHLYESLKDSQKKLEKIRSVINKH